MAAGAWTAGVWDGEVLDLQPWDGIFLLFFLPVVLMIISYKLIKEVVIFIWKREV